MAPLFSDQVAPSTQALALGGPAPSKAPGGLANVVQPPVPWHGMMG